MNYQEATAAEIAWRRKADYASAQRTEALNRMHDSGMSYGQIAQAVGLSRSRVQQLVERGTGGTI